MFGSNIKSPILAKQLLAYLQFCGIGIVKPESLHGRLKLLNATELVLRSVVWNFIIVLHKCVLFYGRHFIVSPSLAIFRHLQLSMGQMHSSRLASLVNVCLSVLQIVTSRDDAWPYASIKSWTINYLCHRLSSSHISYLEKQQLLDSRVALYNY